MFKKDWIFLGVVGLTVSLFFCLGAANAAEPGLRFHLPFEESPP